MECTTFGLVVRKLLMEFRYSLEAFFLAIELHRTCVIQYLSPGFDLHVLFTLTLLVCASGGEQARMPSYYGSREK